MRTDRIRCCHFRPEEALRAEDCEAARTSVAEIEVELDETELGDASGSFSSDNQATDSTQYDDNWLNWLSECAKSSGLCK